jgi:DNA-binding phage protein
MVVNMTEVIGIRVPKKLKEELKELDVDYTDEVRACLEQIVRKKKLKKVLEEADRNREEIYKKIGYTRPAAETIREDRDSDHGNW